MWEVSVVVSGACWAQGCKGLAVAAAAPFALVAAVVVAPCAATVAAAVASVGCHAVPICGGALGGDGSRASGARGGVACARGRAVECLALHAAERGWKMSRGRS